MKRRSKGARRKDRVAGCREATVGAEQLACAKEEGREHMLSAFVFHGGPAGVRTLDLGIKSPLLCQLSYRSVTAKKDYTRNRRAPKQENGVGKGIRTLDLQSHNLAR